LVLFFKKELLSAPFYFEDLMSDNSSPSSYANVAQTIGLTELRAIYPTLTGAGIIVAQIEANLNTSGTGAPEFEPNPGTNTNAAFTFINGSLTTSVYNDLTTGAASSHAEQVGEYFYGAVTDSAGAPEGVAPGVTAVDVYFADSFSLSGITSFPAKVVNLSFAYDTATGGNDLYDQLANQFNAVVVAAAGNGGAVTSPASAYNAIAVSSSTTLLSTGPAADGADKPDISAPGTATSFTAPIVSGAATLLVQAGTNGLPGWTAAEKTDAVDFRTIKAILLNSARKPSDYFTNAYAPTAAQPLSAEYGSGVVNIDAAVTELYAGETQNEYSDQENSGTAIFTSLAGDPVLAENGWSLGTLSNTVIGIPGLLNTPDPQQDVQAYAVTLAAGKSFDATLSWAATDSDTIDHLELYAYDQATGALLASSTATLSSVQQINLTPAASEVVDLFAVLPDSGSSDNSDVYALAYGDPVAPLCYLAGTRILTSRGEIDVENLTPGELVVARGGGLRAVRWIGRQCFAGRFLRKNPERWPVRIHAGALGAGRPMRDLWVSPGHSMLLEGQLVLARLLVNGVTVTQDELPEEVRYCHIELATHDCVLAQGAWSETYADVADMRGQFHNQADFAAQYPDYVPPPVLSLCAPRPETGPALEALLHPVVARAAGSVTLGALHGYIDAVSEEGLVEGWARDADHEDLPVLLEILRGEELLGTALACQYRADVAQAGHGHGRYGFQFRVPPADRHGIWVRRAGDGAVLSRVSKKARKHFFF